MIKKIGKNFAEFVNVRLNATTYNPNIFNFCMNKGKRIKANKIDKEP
jgi:hypothetical protein